MQESLRELLHRRRDRVIAIILGVKERECDKYLPLDAQLKLRKVVLDQINELTDLAIDLIKSVDQDTTVLNELFLEKLDAIHSFVTQNGHA